tara:strand:+ start:60174 stop:60884 length:711 start_codon:yes stop_codon:yes gene_type:complete
MANESMSKIEKMLKEARENPQPAPEFVPPEHTVKRVPLMRHYPSSEASLNRGVMFDDFEEHRDSKHKKIKRQVTAEFETRENLQRGIGFYFFSENPGSGKTMLACALANELHEVKRTESQVINTVEFLSMIRESYDSEGMTEVAIFNNLTTVHLLILDDIGRERHKKEHAHDISWAEEQIDKLVNARISKRLPTIFTSNMDIGSLPYHERLQSRIIGVSEVVKFPDIDVRTIKKVL